MHATRELVDAIRKAHVTGSLEEDECEPYKHKYEAADLLKRVLGERTVFLGSESPPSETASGSKFETSESGVTSSSGPASGFGAETCDAPPPHAAELELAAAAARVRCGLILLETDLLPDGEASIVAGLPQLEKRPELFLAWLLESYNALGALYSQRGELPTALSWLTRAEQLYQRVTDTGTRHAHLALPIAGLERMSQPGPQTEHQPQATASTNGDGDDGCDSGGGGGAGQEEAGGTQAPVPPAAAPVETQAAAAASEGSGGTCQATAGGQNHERRQEGAEAAEAAEAGQSDQQGRGEPGQRAGEAQTGEPRLEERPESEREASKAAAASPSAEAAPSGADEGAAASAEAAAPSGGGGGCEPPLHAQLPANDGEAVQSQYTATLYYLAQVHGHMKAADRSALYCAATLYRQLASGKYELDTWVNNCLQLGGYYAKVHAYGLAMYCHAAAQAVVDRDTAAGRQLGEDVAANVQLATARLHAMRLSASHAKQLEGKELELHYPDVSYFPDYLRFPGLAVPSPDSFPWGLEALASDFEGARELFNTAMPYFKNALSYYQLDGFVTDHVGILMDMSNMYRCLAAFEADPGRAAAMQRCRSQLLEPLSGQLNPTHYPGLSRSIDLELAHVYREVADIRERQGGQAAKVAAAASSAVKFYQRFLRSFAASEGGDLPDRVDMDNEPYFLMASFGLGRMLHKMKVAAQPGSGAADPSYAALVVSAHKHLQWTSAYVKRHGLEAWTQEAQAAEELSELLVERVRLQALAVSRKAAGR